MEFLNWRIDKNLLFTVVLVVVSACIGACDSASTDPDPEPEPDPVAASPVSAVTAVGNPDGTMTITFNRASSEVRVSQYRVILVPTSSNSTLDVAAAQALPAGRYTVVLKTGGQLSVTLGSETKDADGNPVTRGTEYNVYVLTVADGSLATINALASAPGAFSIPEKAADPATEVSAKDVANNNNASDLEVSFVRAADESTVSEYRIILFKIPGAFSSEAADALTTNFVTVPKTGADVKLRLPESAVDVAGAPITNGATYWVFVQSIADGVNAKLNTLAGPAPNLTVSVPSAGSVSDVSVDDVSNNGDSSDLEIAFRRASDETTVSEYRVVVVREDDVTNFRVATAEQLSADSYFAIQPSGTDVRTQLPTGTNDSRGRAIQNDQTYVVFVISMADGVVAGANSLSSPSNTIAVKVTTTKVTFVGNDGVMIEDNEGRAVIIDGIQRGVGWVDLNATQTAAIEVALPPYDEIDVAMITHAHGDHYTIQSVAAHLNNNPHVRVIAPPQVRSGFGGLPRIETISPAFHTKEDVTINDVEITVYHLRHFNQFDLDFSTVENYAYLVRLGGLKFLHMGDVDYAVDNLEGLGLKDEEIDVVFLPTFNTLISGAQKNVIMDQINPKLVIGLHFQRAFVAIESARVLATYANADVFTKPLEFRRY